MEHYFDSEGRNIKDGVQDGRQLGFKDLYDQHTRLKKHFTVDFYLCLEAKLYKQSNKSMVLIQKFEIFKDGVEDGH